MLRDAAICQLRSVRAFAFVALGVAACVSQKERVDPAVARYSILALFPPGVDDAAGWAEDIRAAFHALDIEPTAQNICAVIAVTRQESTFEAQPVVPVWRRLLVARSTDARPAIAFRDFSSAVRST